jgi:cellulose synthase/poly-beta-1,6-N-acetylglucosamine synthase-like glycosyltransferase
MSTAVRDVELTAPPTEIVGLDRYSACLLLLRRRGRPVGAVTLNVVGGRISDEELRVGIAQTPTPANRPSGDRQRSSSNEVERDKGPAPRATVAVCTRDRTADLARCLAALLRLPDDGQEILVIDNAPATDGTRRLVAAHPSIRYVREERPGLNVARNRALHEARSDVIAFCDDDAAPDPRWLRALMRNFDDPSVLAVTGLTMPLELETPAQEWFERLCRFGRGFERIVFDQSHPAAGRPGAPGVGANMALRRVIQEWVGAFDEALDAGTPTCSGGDNEMFARILTAGYRIVYDPDALSWHRHRRTWPELRRTLYGYRVGLYAMWARQVHRDRDVAILRQAVGRIFRQQLPLLARSLLGRPGSAPLDLRAAELAGCLVGPIAYWMSARRSSRYKLMRSPDA